MKRTDELKAAIDELRKHGATEIVTVGGGKGGHPRLKFVYDGKPRSVVVSNSPSDQNARHLIREHIRQKLGIVRAKKVGLRRTRRLRNGSAAAEAPTSLTPGRDPFVPIYGTAIHMAALQVALDRAWREYFADLLRDAGHEPINPLLRTQP